MSAKKTLVFTTTITVTLIVIFFSNEWNRAALGTEGYIDEGSKFGIEIGSNTQDVITRLIDRGLVDAADIGKNETHYNPQECHSRLYADDIEVRLLWDRSWRQGTICIASKSGVIVGVSWWYGMFQP